MESEDYLNKKPEFRINVPQTTIETLRMLCHVKEQNNVIIGMLIGIKNMNNGIDKEQAANHISKELLHYDKLIVERATSEFHKTLPDILD